MTRTPAAERYAARKIRVAIDMRERLLVAAASGARHAYLHAKYGPNWRRILTDNLNRRLPDWYATAERNPRTLSDSDFRRFYQNNPDKADPELLIARHHQDTVRAVNENLWRSTRRPRNPHPDGGGVG